MDDITELDLEELGLAAGRQIAGDTIDRVRVVPGFDWMGDPKYDFWFVIDTDRLPAGQGYVMIKLRQKLMVDLSERSDPGSPFVHFISEEGWSRRFGA